MEKVEIVVIVVVVMMTMMEISVVMDSISECILDAFGRSSRSCKS